MPEKFEAMVAMLKSLQAAGYPEIHVGSQMHVEIYWAPTYEQMTYQFAILAEIGVDMIISEMDVACNEPCDQMKQAAIYKAVF